jgi:phage-related protein
MPLARVLIEATKVGTGRACRTVYTVKISTAIYALHAFQKKSKSGIKTPAEDLELIKRRLKLAETDHQLEEGKAS